MNHKHRSNERKAHEVSRSTEYIVYFQNDKPIFLLQGINEIPPKRFYLDSKYNVKDTSDILKKERLGS